MSALEWPSVDSNGISLPAIVSSSDLFDGELFGDELIDIYNSAMNDHGEDVHHGEYDVFALVILSFRKGANID